MSAWDDPAGRIRELEAEVYGLRKGIEALADKADRTMTHDGLIGVVFADDLRTLLTGDAR